MLNFNVGFSLPEHWIKLKPLDLSFLLEKPITKNKSISIQGSHFNWANLIGITFDLSFNGCDHAGLFFDLTLLGYDLIINIYDNRRWARENNKWEES